MNFPRYFKFRLTNLSSCIRTAGGLRARLVLGKQSFDELTRIEGPQIFDIFSNSDEPDRQLQLLGYRNNNTSLGRAIELGQDHSRERHRITENLCLAQCILAGGGVEDEPALVWRSRQFAPDHASNLLQFLHQIDLGL